MTSSDAKSVKSASWGHYSGVVTLSGLPEESQLNVFACAGTRLLAGSAPWYRSPEVSPLWAVVTAAVRGAEGGALPGADEGHGGRDASPWRSASSRPAR